MNKKVKDYKLNKALERFLDDYGLTQIILELEIDQEKGIEYEYDDYRNVIELYVRDGVVYASRATIPVMGWDEIQFDEETYNQYYGERE